MQHDKSPGNDRLTKQFYETFLKHYERKSLLIQCQKLKKKGILVHLKDRLSLD